MANESDRSELEAARQALAAGHAEEAVHKAKRFMLTASDHPDALRVLFEGFQRLGRPDDACVAGRRLVDAAPTDFDARLQTARLELQQGRPSKVIGLLAEHAGEDRAASALLADAYERAGQTVLAASVRDALPRSEWVGQDLNGTGDFRRRYFSGQLCKLLRDHASPGPRRDELIEALDEARYPEAVSLFQEWVREAGAPVRALALADWFLLSGQRERARSVLDQSAEDPALRGARQNRLGDLAQAEGDFEEARAHYRKATVLDPTDSNAWLDLARTEFLRGDRSAAVDACREVLALELADEDERWLAREFLDELKSENTQGALEPGLYGLVWWERGGGLLEIEVAERDDDRGLVLTGTVGRTLEDAARVAYQFVKSELGCFEETGAHIHFPGFRSPKDGGSAGLLLGVLLYASDANQRVDDRVAVTGELTLGGEVRPVGGIREKVTSAHLHGADRVVLPADNTGDLLKVPLSAKRSLEFDRVRTFADVLEGLGW